jgi:hypothetical protein
MVARVVALPASTRGRRGNGGSREASRWAAAPVESMPSWAALRRRGSARSEDGAVRADKLLASDGGSAADGPCRSEAALAG